jgi:uncharacterized protein YidB (DUF937 family)
MRTTDMGLLDQVLGNVGGGSSPIGGILASLLSGGQQPSSSAMPLSTAGSNGGTSGGLGSLISRFEQAGLGGVAQSWVGSGPNQPVSPNQLQSVFGENQVQSMASQAGMQPHDFLAQLSEHLPRAVDAMTPSGRLPDEGSRSV